MGPQQSCKLVQGHDWSELDIFDAAGLQIFETGEDNLFRLVDQQRVDLFLSGLVEIEGEPAVVRRFSDQLILNPYLLVAFLFAASFISVLITRNWLIP